MEEKRESGVVYRSFVEAGRFLTEEQRGKYYTLIFDQMFDFNIGQSDDPIVNAMFVLISPQIEANIRKYENGKKPKTSKTEAKQKQSKSKTKGNVDVYVYVDDDVYEDVDKKKTNNKYGDFIFSDEVEEKIKEFVEYRKQSKKKMTERAVELLKMDLKKWGLPDSVVIKQIENSIIRGYSGIFKPNDSELKNILPNKVDWYYENVRSKLDKLTPPNGAEPSPERMEILNNAKAQYGEKFFIEAKTAYVQHQNSI